MSEQLTYIVQALEALEPFDSKTFTNETDHESVSVWYTEWFLTRNTLPNIEIKQWHVCGPDLPMRSCHCLMDAANMIAKELEHII